MNTNILRLEISKTRHKLAAMSSFSRSLKSPSYLSPRRRPALGRSMSGSSEISMASPVEDIVATIPGPTTPQAYQNRRYGPPSHLSGSESALVTRGQFLSLNHVLADLPLCSKNSQPLEPHPSSLASWPTPRLPASQANGVTPLEAGPHFWHRSSWIRGVAASTRNIKWCGDVTGLFLAPLFLWHSSSSKANWFPFLDSFATFRVFIS